MGLNDNDAVVFFEEDEFACPACEKGFVAADNSVEGNTPIMVLVPCEETPGAVHQMVFHEQCLPEEIAADVRANREAIQKANAARWN